MFVSYEISLCLCEIRIYLFVLFTFAKIPDNNIYVLFQKIENKRLSIFCGLFFIVKALKSLKSGLKFFGELGTWLIIYIRPPCIVDNQKKLITV